MEKYSKNDRLLNALIISTILLSYATATSVYSKADNPTFLAEVLSEDDALAFNIIWV